MHVIRQGPLSSASRRMRRARRTSGRILVSVLGFGMAYYFDTDNGAARRTQLRHSLRRTARRLGSVLGSEVGDPPPSFYPALRGVAEPAAPDRRAFDEMIETVGSPN